MADNVGARFERLVGIMRALRAPDGCPWDREQTLASLRPYASMLVIANNDDYIEEMLVALRA